MTPTRTLVAQPREAQPPVLEQVCSGGTGHEGQGQKGDAGAANDVNPYSAWPRGKFSTLIILYIFMFNLRGGTPMNFIFFKTFIFYVISTPRVGLEHTVPRSRVTCPTG